MPTPQFQAMTLSDVSSDALTTIGRWIETDATLLLSCPVFCRTIHGWLVQESERRKHDAFAPSAELRLPERLTPADLSDLLRGTTALSFLGNQDEHLAAFVDSLTVDVAFRAAAALDRLERARAN